MQKKIIINSDEVRHLTNWLTTNDVIISPVDTAGRFVIMKGFECRKKMGNELNNGKYILLDKDPDNLILKS